MNLIYRLALISRRMFIFSVFLSVSTMCWAEAEIRSMTMKFDHSVWNTILQKHVVVLPGNSATQVNYSGILTDKIVFASYLKMTSSITRETFDSWPKDEQLAFLINAYNAWTVKLITDNYANIKSIKDIGNVFQSPWKKTFIPLLGKVVSLDEIEHNFIRGSDRYNDPRVHFAVNCASIGCPALRNEAYTANKLQAQLEEQTQRFLRDRSRNGLIKDTLTVSPIFDWYHQDFEKGFLGIKSLTEFFARYAEPLGLTNVQVASLKSGAIEIEYGGYDWNLNVKNPNDKKPNDTNLNRK